VAQKLFGALTIDGGVPGQGVAVEEFMLANKPPAGQNSQNGAKKGWFCKLFGLKIAKNVVFRSKILNKIYSQDVFEEYIIL
jgi:hypothetical protein